MAKFHFHQYHLHDQQANWKETIEVKVVVEEMVVEVEDMVVEVEKMVVVVEAEEMVV